MFHDNSGVQKLAFSVQRAAVGDAGSWYVKSINQERTDTMSEGRPVLLARKEGLVSYISGGGVE